VVAVADADSDLAAHAAAGAVSLLVGQVGRVVCAIDVSGLGDDAAAVAGESVETP
jgi:hypothetical protein